MMPNAGLRQHSGPAGSLLVMRRKGRPARRCRCGGTWDEHQHYGSSMTYCPRCACRRYRPWHWWSLRLAGLPGTGPPHDDLVGGA
jgi:hypothetical protein